MPKPNTSFELSVEDIALIEHALRGGQFKYEDAVIVLAKIHNQKEWYKPKDKFS